MKTCIICGETKHNAGFSKMVSSPDGRRNECKTCHGRLTHPGSCYSNKDPVFESYMKMMKARKNG